MREINEFIDYLLWEKNMSQNTADSYRRDLSQFFTEVGKGVTEVTSEDISRFIRQLRAEGCKVSTANRKLSCLKSFYKYLTRKGVVPYSPAEAVDGGKREKRLPKPIERGDIEKIFKACRSLKEKAVVEILYATGVRREELVKLKKSDVNYERGFIRVVGKGNKERIIPIHDAAIQIIKELAAMSDSEWLFPSEKKEGEHITPRQVNNIVETIAKRAGLTGITPHRFRHSFCSHLYDGGANPKAIKDMAGHGSYNTTDLYTEISVERNMNEYRQAHPRSLMTV